MGKPEINQKLKSFLINQPFNHECQSLYLMVEIRKILDHAYGKNNYTLLRFYCDWTLHTKKSQKLKHIAPIIEKIYASVKLEIENHPLKTSMSSIGDFLYMKDLKNEMRQFLISEELPTDLCDNKSFWIEFVKLMVSILADQPIIKPTKDVRHFILQSPTAGRVEGNIGFNKPISNKDANYDHYLFWNTY